MLSSTKPELVNTVKLQKRVTATDNIGLRIENLVKFGHVVLEISSHTRARALIAPLYWGLSNYYTNTSICEWGGAGVGWCRVHGATSRRRQRLHRRRSTARARSRRQHEHQVQQGLHAHADGVATSTAANGQLPQRSLLAVLLHSLLLHRITQLRQRWNICQGFKVQHRPRAVVVMTASKTLVDLVLYPGVWGTLN